MQRRTLIHTAALAAAACSALVSLPAAAQGAWPTGKPVTYVVPFAAGGTTDTLARLIGQQLGTALGTTVVVENKGGAAGTSGPRPLRAQRLTATPCWVAQSARTPSTSACTPSWAMTPSNRSTLSR